MPTPDLADPHLLDGLLPTPGGGAGAADPAQNPHLLDALVPEGHYDALSRAMGKPNPVGPEPVLQPVPDERGTLERATDGLATGIGVGARSFGRGLGSVADTLSTPLSRLAGDSTPQTDAYERAVDQQQQAQDAMAVRDAGVPGRVGEFIGGGVPWVASLPLAVTADAGNRYLDSREAGHGPAASLGLAAGQGAVDVASAGIAGKGAAYLGERFLASAAPAAQAVATRAVAGAGTGSLLAGGSAAVSAAGGDYERARGELASAAPQALTLGLLDAGTAGLHAALGHAEDAAVAHEPETPATEVAPAAAAESAPAILGQSPAADPAQNPHLLDALVPPPAPEGVPHGVPAEEIPSPATAHVQGPPGEPAPEGSGREAETGSDPRQSAAPAPSAPGDAAELLNREHDVPLFGGTSTDGKTVYIDRNAPTTIDVNGKPANVDTYTAIHERAEKLLMDQGMSYADAHDHAVAAENAALRADGHDPAAYNAALKQHIDAAAAKSNPQLPPNVEPKPYRESGLGHLTPEVQRGDGLDTQAGVRAPDEAPAPVPAAAADAVPNAERAPVLPPVDQSTGKEPALPVREPAPAAPPVAEAARPATADAPVADQRATSLRPDLAIPTSDPAARDAFKRVDERRTLGGEPSVRSRASQREAAAERMSADAGGEAAKVVSKVMRGDALNEQEQHILKTTGDRHLAAGDVAEAERHYELMRVARTEGARAHGYGVDPSEPPGKRAQSEVAQKIMAPDKATQDLMESARREKNSAKYEALLNRHLATVKQHLADVKRLSGVDPLDLAQEKSPTTKPTRQEKTLTVDREWRDLKKKFFDSFRKTTSAGALGGEQLDLLSKMIANRIKAGILKAADIATELAQRIPRFRRDPEMQKAFAAEWEKQTGEKVDTKALFEKSVAEQRKAALEQLAKVVERHLSGEGPEAHTKRSRDPEVQAILDTAKELNAEIRERATKPSPTLEQRIAATRDKLATAVERHAGAMGQSDAERTQTIADRRAPKPEQPPEIQKLLDEVKRLGDDVKKRDKTLEPPKTLAQRVEAAQKALNDAIERHGAAMGQTPAERLEAMEAKAKAKEPIPPEVKTLLDQRKALDAEVKARDRLIYRNAIRVLDASRTLKADAWDKFDEAFRSGLHTSFQLPWYKASSDFVNKIHTWIADDLGAAILNHIIPGGTDPRSLADAPYILKALIPSMMKGAQYGLDGLREDRNVFADEVRGARAAKEGKGVAGIGERDEFHQQTHALSPIPHNVLGWNMRLIGAEQTALESAFAHAQVGAEAHRLAVDADGNRLTGEALQKHMQEQVDDLASPAWTNAVKVAHRDTNVTAPSVLNPVYWLNRVKNANLRENEAITSKPGAFPVLRTAQSALRAIAPFTTVPTNIVLRGVYGMTPLNGASIAVRTLRAIMRVAHVPGGKAYARAQFNTDASRHVLGWLITAGVASAMYDKDGNRRITGYAYNKAANDEGQPPPHSVLINGKWWDYGKFLGAGGHAVGALVDALDAVHAVTAPGKKEDAGTAAKDAFGTLREHVTDETFMRSVGDMVAASRSSGGFAKYVGMLASSLVPTEVKQAVKSTSSTVPDHRSKDRSFGGRVAQTVKQQLGIENVATVDAFGHEVPKDDLLNSPVTSALARLLAPVHGRASEIGDGADKYRHLIMRWNDENPGDKIKIGTGAPELTIELKNGDKKKIELTPQQHHDMHVEAGQKTMALLSRATINTEHPTARDKTILVNCIKAGQGAARAQMAVKVARDSRAASASSPAGADSSKP